MEFLGELTDDEDFLEYADLVLHPRIPRVFRTRVSHFNKWSEVEFKERFRLSKNTVTFIIDLIGENIASVTNWNHAVTPSEMVLVTLRFLATGSTLQGNGDFSGIHSSTTSRIVIKVCRAIAQLYRQFIEMPNTEDEVAQVRQEFFNISKFPRCIGAVDCTHVKIQSPGGDNAEIYRNRKSFFSMNVQAICDAKLKIRNLVCRWPGSSHDSTIFNNSRIKAKFENGLMGDSLIVGDAGYGIKSYLITPLSNPQTEAEQLFNEAQIRTRNPIERCYGVWKRRFPILALGIRLDKSKVEAIVVTTAILHNIACLMRDEQPTVTAEEETAVQLINNVEGFQQLEEVGNNSTRLALIEYFRTLL